jgi:hypothetical protein
MSCGEDQIRSGSRDGQSATITTTGVVLAGRGRGRLAQRTHGRRRAQARGSARARPAVTARAHARALARAGALSQGHAERRPAAGEYLLGHWRRRLCGSATTPLSFGRSLGHLHTSPRTRQPPRRPLAHAPSSPHHSKMLQSRQPSLTRRSRVQCRPSCCPEVFGPVRKFETQTHAALVAREGPPPGRRVLTLAVCSSAQLPGLLACATPGDARRPRARACWSPAPPRSPSMARPCRKAAAAGASGGWRALRQHCLCERARHLRGALGRSRRAYLGAMSVRGPSRNF